MEKNSYSHILKYTGLFGGVQGLNILVGILRNKFVAVILGPDGMGLVSLFNSTINLVGNATNLGISTSGVKNISEAFEQGDQERLEQSIAMVRTWVMLTAVLGTVVCALLSPFFHHFTFTWGDHSLHFLLLSPVVGLLTLTGGELAVLKGTRELRRLAVVSFYGAVATLIISVPIYYFFNQSGIVPSLILTALAQMLLTIAFSYKLHPLKFIRQRKVLGQGMSMVRLGVAFVLAGVFGSLAELVIRSFLNVTASLDMVGFYNAGYMMTMMYAGVVFSAMETDFYPRLSAVNTDTEACNLTINRQIEVSLLLVSPLLVAFMIGMPVLLPMLYSKSFLPVLGMVQITIFAIYFRAVKLPVAYLPLAKGDSFSFLLLETIYFVILVILVVWGFRTYGLTGAGIAITVTGVLEWLWIWGYCMLKYKYRPTLPIFKYMLMQLAVGVLAFVVTQQTDGWVYWLSGTALFVVSLAISLSILHSKTSLWKKLRQKLRFDN